MLWQTICGSKLLAKANMIIFLNKVDLLTLKLRSGVKIRQYLPSYGDRSNDMGTMVRCELFFSSSARFIPLCTFGQWTDLRSKFKDILKEYSTEERSCYFHATTVIVRCSFHVDAHLLTDCVFQGYKNDSYYNSRWLVYFTDCATLIDLV
jgi:hypothetical protein